MSAYFTAGGAAEREKTRKRKGNSPLRRSGRERDGTGTKPGNATAGRNDGRQGGNKKLYYAEWGASEALVPSWCVSGDRRRMSGGNVM